MPKENKELGPTDARVIATVVIWVCFTILMIIISSRSPHFFNFTLGLLTVMLAGGSTFVVWRDNNPFDAFGQNEKLKNTDRNVDAVTLLLDLLNDDERDSIRRRLLNNSDGEIPQVFADEMSDERNLQ